MKTILGLYDELDTLWQVVDELRNSGVPDANISLVAPAPEKYQEAYPMDRGTRQRSNMTFSGGAVNAGAVGSLARTLPRLETCTLPGLGPIIATGPVLAWLVKDTMGDGLLNALADWGVGREETEFYAEGVLRGGALIAVKVPDRIVDNVVDVMNHYDPVDIDQQAARWRAAGWFGFDTLWS